jgi:uncharacterized alpha-E superfamily protein
MMLSRMADALYWMSRYLERADNTARLLEINLLHLVETEEGPFGSAQWRPMLTISGGEGTFAQLYPEAPICKKTVIPFMTQDDSNPAAIIHSVRLARENARVVRDRISKEMWESINELWLWSDRELQKPLSPERAPIFYTHLRERVARFHGLALSTMMRGEAHGFYQLATFIERLDMTARILDVKYYILLPDVSLVGSALDYYQWAALLKSLSGFEAYRRLYHAGLRPIDVAEFVIFSSDFPRSLRFCMERMETGLIQIGGQSLDASSWHAFQALKTSLEQGTAQQVFQLGLHEFLQATLAQTAGLGKLLQTDFFEAHLGEPIAIPH